MTTIQSINCRSCSLWLIARPRPGQRNSIEMGISLMYRRKARARFVMARMVPKRKSWIRQRKRRRMTRFSNNYQAVDEDYHSLSTLPLPEAAVVLDIRQRDDDTIPLLAHLNTELADLTAEMRSHHVLHWSYLRDCIALLRLDAIPGDLPLEQDTNYRVASPDGVEQAMLGQEYLASVLSSEYIDQVRSARVDAPDISSSTPVIGGVKQSTVRIFLLTDMREAASLTRAATYAHWLKTWSEREHGRSRRYRDERLHTVILCLNANASYQNVLLQTLGKLPDSAIDTVILLQKYTDADAIIGETAQLVKAELLLYTL